jgi:hypothetical protein
MTKNSTPSSEFEHEDRCPSCGSPCNILTDLDDKDYCNDCRVVGNKKPSIVEWQHIELSKFLDGKSEYTDAHGILNKAKEMHKEEIVLLSAGWAKLREQTRETAMHIGFARGFDCALKCSEDYYEQLDKTDLTEDEFTRDYITDRFEETYGGEK